ncbi:MAG TPA: hypothetical protein VK714_01860 [Myxococcota bacterium]|nr:hypothetical protein [Myxococcota bacterium]
MKPKPRGARRKTLYHRTDGASAAAILEEGFQDGEGTYMTKSVYRGVWLSSVPLDDNECASGDTLVEVSVAASDAELTAFEWVEEGKSYREWLIPAVWLNARATVCVLSEQEESDLALEERPDEG